VRVNLNTHATHDKHFGARIVSARITASRVQRDALRRSEDSMNTNNAPQLCGATIDLRRPLRSERVRDSQSPYRTVYVYKCAVCGNETRVRANLFRGSHPEPSVGAILCPHLAAPSATATPNDTRV